ncbi:uncharacterized protein [Rutidosis leptorrhynchoides]|uniref:uncharacterized protein n=1 Tax=Rutidosis leptorrhynchoides TaxID=125765 RepID=UPI003A9A2E1C
MGRAPCCDKANVKKGPWSPEEDAKLKDFIEKFGTGGNWIALPQKAGLKRCGKSCRLRWLNYLRPNIRHGEFSDDEDRIICSMYASIGSRWSVIAAQLPGRTDNDIKNYWNTKLKKKLMNMFPVYQEKQTFFPSMSLQAPQPSLTPSFDQQFLNTPSSFYTFSPSPNFINVDNTSNSLFAHKDYDYTSGIPNLQSPTPTTSNIENINGNCYNQIGFQDEHHSMCNSPMQYNYYHNASTMKEGMMMFGSKNCFSENGSYIEDLHQKHQYQIKQEHGHINLLGDQIQSHNLMIKNHAALLHDEIDEMKQLNFTSY